MRATSSTAPGAGVDVGAAQLGRQQVPAAEHVERQVAVAVVIAVEEAAFLMPVQRIVGGVEIEDDLLRRSLVRLQEQIDEQRLDRRRVMADLVIARRLGSAQLQPVQRPLAGHRRAVRAPRRELAGQHRHHRVMAQLVMVVEVLVAERDAEHALADQRRHRVLDQLRPATDRGSRRQSARPDPIARSVAPSSSAPASEVIVPPSNAATTSGLRRVQTQTALRYTLSASGRSSNHRKVFVAEELSLIRRPDAPNSVRNAG